MAESISTNNQTNPAADTNPADAQAAEQTVTQQDMALFDQPWMNSFARPLLIALMAAALAIALLTFITRFTTDLAPAYTQGLIGLSVAAALVACYTTTWLAQPGQRGRRNMGYRTAELGLLLFLTRMITWGTTATWPTLELLLMRPVDALLDGYFIAGIFVIGLAWLMAAAMTDDHLQLGLQPDDLYMAQTQTYADRWHDTSRPLYTDRPAILRRFVGRWVVGGVLLVILAAGAQFDAPQAGFLGIARQNIAPAVIIAIVVYFLCGLVLVSQGQLAVLRSRWTLHKTPNAESVMRNWMLYAIGLILLIGLIALLLPLGGTFWAAVIIGTVLQTAYFFILGIFRTIMTLIMLLLSFFTDDQPPQEQPEQPPQAPIIPPEPPPAAFEMPPWAGGLLFWIIIALILSYAAYIYFSGKGFNFNWLRRFWRTLRARWALLFGAYRQWQATRLREFGGGNDKARGKGGLGGFPAWLRLRNLSPTQQVRYYYLTTLHRATQAGLPRRPAETPHKYAPRLARFIEEKNLEHPDEEADIEELTEAFVRVRYANTDIEQARLPVLKSVWERLRRYLRL